MSPKKDISDLDFALVCLQQANLKGADFEAISNTLGWNSKSKAYHRHYHMMKKYAATLPGAGVDVEDTATAAPVPTTPKKRGRAVKASSTGGDTPSSSTTPTKITTTTTDTTTTATTTIAAPTPTFSGFDRNLIDPVLLALDSKTGDTTEDEDDEEEMPATPVKKVKKKYTGPRRGRATGRSTVGALPEHLFEENKDE